MNVCLIHGEIKVFKLLSKLRAFTKANNRVQALLTAVGRYEDKSSRRMGKKRIEVKF